jgi:hypothetical protein
MRFLRKVHLLMQSNDTVLLHKNSMMNFCADGSEIDSYSSKMLVFAIVNIVSVNNNKNITIAACLI